MKYPDPSGEVVTNTYNLQGMGMPKMLSSSVTAYPSPVSDVSYDERGQIKTLVQGTSSNALTTTYTYNVMSWLTKTLVTVPNGSGGTNTLLNLDMTYTTNGNVATISNQGSTSLGSNNPSFSNTYTYDGLNRLTSATSSSSGGNTQLFPDELYTFDDLGRMDTRTLGTTAYTYFYSDTKHVDAPTSYMSNTYQYDAAGNQITGTVKGTTQVRAVDAENRLLSVLTGTNTVSFVYDANGKRVIQTVQGNLSGNVQRTLYIGNLYEEEISSQDRPYIVYYMLGSKMVGLRRDNGSDVGQYRVVTDHLQGTSLIIDTSSPPVVKHRQYYKPYGEVAWEYPSGGSLTTVGYTGQRLDGDTGLMYFGARYYDPVLIHFTSADPTVPDEKHALDFHKYLYVRGNPLTLIDELGFGPNDHYVFVAGCVFSPCQDPLDLGNFGDYRDILKQLFEEGHWGDLFPDSQTGEPMTFEAWAKIHVHTLHVSSLLEGALHIDTILKKIQGNADIHLFGTSQGGAAIFQYLAYVSDPYFSHYGLGPIDPRIASVTTIDSPLGLVDYPKKKGVAGSGYNTFENIASTLESKTRVRTAYVWSENEQTALTVDVPDTPIYSPHVPGIGHHDQPNYDFWFNLQPGVLKHITSGAIASPDTREFLVRVWK